MTLHNVFREFFARAVGDTAESAAGTQFTTRATVNTQADAIVAVAHPAGLDGNTCSLSSG